MTAADSLQRLMSPAAVLRATADHFEANPDEWGRLTYCEPLTGKRCALGGIALVLAPDDRDGDPYWIPDDEGCRRLAASAIAALEAYLVTEVGFHSPCGQAPLVGEWNDQQPNVAEVVQVLRAAADMSEARS